MNYRPLFLLLLTMCAGCSGCYSQAVQQMIDDADAALATNAPEQQVQP